MTYNVFGGMLKHYSSLLSDECGLSIIYMILVPYLYLCLYIVLSSWSFVRLCHTVTLSEMHR